MAISKLVFTIISILLFNLCISTLARPIIKTHNKLEYSSTYENIINWRRIMLENDATMTTLDSPNLHVGVEAEKFVDDFRPTDPGHSPGAGHSTPTIPTDANVLPRP
ncbi:unnamed protein product [Lathyrus sativus]|nr:unnamed protein product [Lathyrus sativus]